MTPDCRTALDELVARTAAAEHLASVAWGVVQDGQVVEHGAAGTLDDDTVPDTRTVYRIASMTKSFTAAVVLALRDEGLWTLDDPVARHAPELAAVRGPAGSPPITLRHLLSMTAGMATDDPWADRHLDIAPEEIDQVYAAGPTFAHLPNTAFEYSNLGFAMIGRAIRRATGLSAQQHITERLLQPLGLADTTWVQPSHDRWARPYRVEDDRIVRDLPEPLGDGEIAPMGGLWSTVADLAIWVDWLDSANSRPDQPDAIALSAASRREMQRMHTYAGVTPLAGHSSPTGYGFGLNVRDDAALGKVVAHSGGLPGYGSNMRWLAGRGVGVIALSNCTYAPMSRLTLQVLHVLHEHGATPAVPPVHAPAWEATAHRLIDLLNGWSDAAAHALFDDNVALDESFQRRSAAAARLLATHGPLRIVGLRPTAATSGSIDVQGTAGVFAIEMTQSPFPGAPVQTYDLPGDLPGG